MNSGYKLNTDIIMGSNLVFIEISIGFYGLWVCLFPCFAKFLPFLLCFLSYE